MIVWIASYPRSGNSFCRLALCKTFGIRSTSEYDLKPAPGRPEPKPNSFSYHTGLTIQGMLEHPDYFYVKTHHLPRQEACPAIYLVRDGRDSMVSYTWHYLLKGQGRSPESITPAIYHHALHQLLVDTRSPFGRWGQNVLAWLKRPHTHIIPFERLIAAPSECITQALAALSLPGDPIYESIPSFNDLHKLKPQSYRRGVIGSWQDEFPPDLLDLFWDLNGQAMQSVGYVRDCV